MTPRLGEGGNTSRRSPLRAVLQPVAARLKQWTVRTAVDAAHAIDDDRLGPDPTRTARHASTAGRDSTDLVLAEILRTTPVDDLNDPVAFADFLRTCIEPRGFDVTWLRRAEDPDADAHRFEAVIARLGSEVSPIPVAPARDIAQYADRLRGRRERYQQLRWLGDIGSHAAAASSDGRAGRVLSTAVRYGRPGSCVELGTAYGVSSMFLLAELERTCPGSRLVTVDVREPQYGIAREALTTRHGDRVRCEMLQSPDDLTPILEAAAPIDFVFHDAEHSGEAYVRDFARLLPHLAPGAIVLFDNIKWEHAVFSGGASGTYEGWREVANHASVLNAAECQAPELTDAWGVLQVR